MGQIDKPSSRFHSSFLSTGLRGGNFTPVLIKEPGLPVCFSFTARRILISDELLPGDFLDI